MKGTYLWPTLTMGVSKRKGMHKMRCKLRIVNMFNAVTQTRKHSGNIQSQCLFNEFQMFPCLSSQTTYDNNTKTAS